MKTSHNRVVLALKKWFECKQLKKELHKMKTKLGKNCTEFGRKK